MLIVFREFLDERFAKPMNNAEIDRAEIGCER
jgi:hypothetical protein